MAAFDASKLQWGPGGQWAYDPVTKTYFQGQYDTGPTATGADDMGNQIYNANGQRGAAMWGSEGLAPGTTQWLPSKEGWGATTTPVSAADFDLSGVAPDIASRFNRASQLTSFKNAPTGVEVTQAPDEGLGPWFRTMAMFAALAGGAGGISNALGAGGSPWMNAPVGDGFGLDYVPGSPLTDTTTLLPPGTDAPWMRAPAGDFFGPDYVPGSPLNGETTLSPPNFNGPQNRAPVEDRSRIYDPKSQNFLPNLGNVASSLASRAGLSAGAAGSVGNAASGLSAIKNGLSLTSAVGSLLQGLNMPSVGETGSTLARASDGARRRVVSQNLDQINGAFAGFDDKYYNSIADAFKNYYQPQVNRQFDTAQRNLLYSAPGGVGSTEFARQLSEAERERQQAGTDVADSAQNEALSARNQIEGTRANLLGLAESSEDPGALGQQAIAGAQASSYTPKYSAIGDLVSRYASLANAAGSLESAGYGRQTVRPISFGGGGSRSAVRNAVV